MLILYDRRLAGVWGEPQIKMMGNFWVCPREQGARGRGASVVRQNPADFVRNTFELRLMVVMVGKLLIDFQDAVQKFVNGIENGSEKRVIFFEAANYINLKNFIIE
ncbi:MAG: hypothetical protein AAB539_04705 [Patescibacteria group bacterium]